VLNKFSWNSGKQLSRWHQVTDGKTEGWTRPPGKEFFSFYLVKRLGVWCSGDRHWHNVHTGYRSSMSADFKRYNVAHTNTSTHTHNGDLLNLRLILREWKWTESVSHLSRTNSQNNTFNRQSNTCAKREFPEIIIRRNYNISTTINLLGINHWQQHVRCYTAHPFTAQTIQSLRVWRVMFFKKKWRTENLQFQILCVPRWPWEVNFITDLLLTPTIQSVQM